MHRTYVGLYEEPTLYKSEYIKYSENQRKQSKAKREIVKLDQNNKLSILLINTTTANDTYQQLSYETRLPFNALWESKHSITTRVKPALKRQILQDPHLDEVIKTRPRVYMSPAVCPDDMSDKNARRLMVNYIYQTPWHIACKETWMNFEPRHPCTAYTAIEKRTKMHSKKVIKPSLPLGFPSVAREWDRLNKRIFPATTDEEENDPQRKTKCEEFTKCHCDILLLSDEQQEVRDLITKNRLSNAYDKFPLSYGGFRPNVAQGVPLKNRNAFTF